MRYWLIGALALALMACGEDGTGVEVDPVWANAPTRPSIETWTPEECPFGESVSFEMSAPDRTAIDDYTFRTGDAESPGASRVVVAGVIEDLPFTWRPELGFRECVGATYQYQHPSGRVVGSGRLIVACGNGEGCSQ